MVYVLDSEANSKLAPYTDVYEAVKEETDPTVVRFWLQIRLLNLTIGTPEATAIYQALQWLAIRNTKYPQSQYENPRESKEIPLHPFASANIEIPTDCVSLTSGHLYEKKTLQAILQKQLDKDKPLTNPETHEAFSQYEQKVLIDTLDLRTAQPSSLKIMADCLGQGIIAGYIENWLAAGLLVASGFIAIEDAEGAKICAIIGAVLGALGTLVATHEIFKQKYANTGTQKPLITDPAKDDRSSVHSIASLFQ